MLQPQLKRKKFILYADEKDETYAQSGKEKIKVSVNARIALLKE